MALEQFINRRMTVEDFQNPEWRDVILDMHALMKVPKHKMNTYAYCTDRRAILHRVELETFKHWEYPWIIKHGNFRKGAKILDCGCGRGVLQFYLARQGYQITSVDISTMKARYLRKFWDFVRKLKLPFKEDPSSVMNALAKRYGTNIDFRVANIASLPFPDESFDYVYSVSVLEHMDEGEDVMAIKEMSRVLKKGGLLLVTVDFAPTKMFRKAYTKADILNLIEASGLSFDNRYDYDFNVADWDTHLKELRTFFKKKNPCETSTATFLLRK